LNEIKTQMALFASVSPEFVLPFPKTAHEFEKVN
jgi:hypothetical protein